MKRRSAAWLGVALAWGCDKTDREPKTLRARPAAPRPATTAPKGTPSYASLEQTTLSILLDAMSSEWEPENEIYLRERLVEVLALERLGTVAARVEVAETEVAALGKRLAGERPIGEALTPLQERAIEQEAKRWARRIVTRLTSGKAQRRTPPPGYRWAPWRVLTGFTYRAGMTLPPAAQALDGQRIAIDGYMIVTSRGRDGAVEQFVLTESLWGCCFARTPQVHEGVVVTAPNVTAHEGPVTVAGTLAVQEKREKGEVTSVYQLRAHRVTPLQP